MIFGADRWLSLLYDLLHEALLQQRFLHADETSLQVLHEPGRAAETKSYIWLYRSGQAGPPIVLYDYQRTRGSEHPRQFLAGFTGYLHVDGYPGYHDLPGVTLSGCWSHARRKWTDVLKGLPPMKTATPLAAQIGLDYCNRLFAIERGLKKATPEERYQERLKQSKPILEAFLSWLHIQKEQSLPKSAFGQAVTYCLNQWSKLEVFLQDGHLEIDNNRSERSIKPFVIGRKGWLFSNTPRGAKASATVYSLVETAKENGLVPLKYLQYLFEQLPNLPPQDPTSLIPLLPWSPELPDSIRHPRR